MGNISTKTGVNKLLMLSTLVLMCVGCAVVYTASTTHALKLGLTPEYYLKAHCMKVVIALAAMFVAVKVDYSVWKKGARVIFGVGCILTIAAIVAGGDVKGASRWIWGIQPSEILKLGLITMVCTKLSEAGSEIKTLKCSLIQPCVPFMISAILLALQPNFSMLILFAGITLSVLMVAGARAKYLLPAIGASAVVGVMVLLIKSHTSKRIAAFLDPTANQNSAMQGERALEALGNGGFFGTGVGMGMQKLGYLPEAHKDVVYAVLGEEAGFLGTSFILVLFGCLFYEGFEIARNSSTRFGKYMAVALTISLFLNFLVHVSVSTGLFPTTGQPLPFLSFGGTNLIFSALFVGILLNISKSGTGKNIVEPYMSSTDNTAAHTFSDFDFTRTET
ncbi:MAG: putative lipid II flippase FtsW [Fibrobacter sp.]|nr:putative lipid II flippase FtsW [Fibrobacter sp.]